MRIAEKAPNRNSSSLFSLVLASCCPLLSLLHPDAETHFQKTQTCADPLIPATQLSVSSPPSPSRNPLLALHHIAHKSPSPSRRRSV